MKFVTDEQGDDEADVHVCCLCQAVLLFLRMLYFLGKNCWKITNYAVKVLSWGKSCLLMYHHFSEATVFCTLGVSYYM